MITVIKKNYKTEMEDEAKIKKEWGNKKKGKEMNKNKDEKKIKDKDEINDYFRFFFFF